MAADIGATLIALAAGILGGAAFDWAGVPLPWLLGSIFGVCIVVPTPLPLRLPVPLLHLALVTIGILLGAEFVPSRIVHIFDWWPAVLGISVYLVVSSAFGWLFFRYVAGYDRLTALFSLAPGGLAMMIAYGEMLGANTVRIALAQSMRLIAILAAVPLALVGSGLAPLPPETQPAELAGLSLLVLIGCGLVGYLLALRLALPGSYMIVPLGLSAAVHLFGFPPSPPPETVMAAIQVVLGVSVGLGFQGVHLRQVFGALFFGACWGLALVSSAAVFAWLLTSYSNIGFPAHFLAMAPGGLPEMAAVAFALGIEVAFVVSLNLFRFIIVIVCVPILVSRIKYIAPGASGD